MSPLRETPNAAHPVLGWSLLAAGAVCAGIALWCTLQLYILRDGAAGWGHLLYGGLISVLGMILADVGTRWHGRRRWGIVVISLNGLFHPLFSGFILAVLHYLLRSD